MSWFNTSPEIPSKAKFLRVISIPTEELSSTHTVWPNLRWKCARKPPGAPRFPVEIGVYNGGSLSMWLHYFGAGAYVYGVDIEPACRSYASDRIDVHIGDQADPAFWRRFRSEIPPIDVLIDDGGHQAHQQIATLKATLPAMSPGGVYLCEDSQGPMHPFHSFVDGLGRYLHDARGEPNPLQQHVESIHRYPLVTVIEKPLLPVPRFESPKHGTKWEPSVRV